MKKRIIIPLLISTLSLSGCCLFSHDFAEATCTTPSTCTKCGEIQGEALGHTFIDATCTEAKTCSVCNFAEGNPLEHQWLEATTENPKTCDRCGLTEGEPLQDDFSQAKIDDHEVKIEAEPEVEVEPGEVIDLKEPDTPEVQSAMDELDELLKDVEVNTDISPYAGKTSKHGWVYPDDYVEYGPRYVDARSDAEMLFDEGAIDEAGYQEWVEAAEILKDFETSDTSSSQGTLEDLAREIATSNPPSGGNDGGSSTPATGGAPIEVPPAKEYEKTGRLCY